MNMMSTPTIWIFFPLLLSLVLSAVHRLHKLSVWIACLGSLLLSVAALSSRRILTLRWVGGISCSTTLS